MPHHTRTAADLEDTLHRIDGRGYPAYRDLKGAWALREREDGAPRLTLHVDRVQADPFAPPSRMRVSVDARTAALPRDLIDDLPGRVATADFILRRVDESLSREPGGVSAGTPTQEIIERSGVAVTAHGVEARLSVPLPADRRRVRGRQADELLLDALPDAVGRHLRADGLDLDALRRHVTLYRDQLAAQLQLHQRGLVGFVADGAVLPRRSGVSDSPLTDAVPFRAPAARRVTLTLPSGRSVSGLGIPRGLTVIIGGGFHGKSTLLRALVTGVHPRIEGDGREFVLSVPGSVAIRSEDGRAVTDVDISAFIADLPQGTDTRHFTTPNASGSTSQAAAISEAVEVGASTLFLDEDTCATNFMMRDEIMRSLVTAEPITPLVERIDQLTSDGVSVVLVAGGSAAFLPHATLVLAMEDYEPTDVTDAARAAAADLPRPTPGGGPVRFSSPSRVLTEGGLAPRSERGKRPRPPAAKGRGVIRMGDETLDATATQLIDHEQTEGAARALAWLEANAGGETLATAVGHLRDALHRDGLSALTEGEAHPGHAAAPRAEDVAAAVNRYRRLRLTH